MDSGRQRAAACAAGAGCGHAAKAPAEAAARSARYLADQATCPDAARGREVVRRQAGQVMGSAALHAATQKAAHGAGRPARAGSCDHDEPSSYWARWTIGDQSGAGMSGTAKPWEIHTSIQRRLSQCCWPPAIAAESASESASHQDAVAADTISRRMGFSHGHPLPRGPASRRKARC